MEKKILLVDDSYFVTKVVSDILKNENFEVIIAHNGEECLSILKVEKPDLVLLDMMLPVMSGRKVLEMIREDPHTKDVKIILLTAASFSEQGKAQLSNLDVADCIEKKFDNLDLEEMVARIKKVLYHYAEP